MTYEDFENYFRINMGQGAHIINYKPIFKAHYYEIIFKNNIYIYINK